MNLETIKKYLDSHSLSWSETTLRAERYRLVSIAAHLESGMGPAALYTLLRERLSESTLKTTFIRIASLYDFAAISPNPYREFIKNSPRLFRYAIMARPAPCGLKGAREAIEQMRDPECKRHAQSLLNSGLRWSESVTADLNKKTVVGKGAKPRRVFGDISGFSSGISYKRFWNELRKVGLRPHDLRKILATELANGGADHIDLMKIFGWSNIQTASFYLQPKKDQELEALVLNTKGAK